MDMDIIKMHLSLFSFLTLFSCGLPDEKWSSSTTSTNVSTSYQITTEKLTSAPKETEMTNDENKITYTEVSGLERITREEAISFGNTEEGTRDISILSPEPTTNEGILSTLIEYTTTADSSTIGEEVPSTISRNISLLSSPNMEETTSDYKTPNITPTLNVSIIDNISELYIGMKAIVRIILTSQTGHFDVMVISMSQNQNQENFDIELKECKVGRAIQNRISYFNPVSRILENTGFAKTLHYRYHWVDADVYPSESEEHQQFSCEFYVFFHNAKGLVDRQQIATNYHTMTVLGKRSKDFNGEVIFTARTSLLSMNKTAFYTMDPGTPSNISSKINFVTKIVFKAWIPFYNPQIVVRLDGSNNEAMYLRVRKIGNNFIPGAEIPVLKTCGKTNSTASIQFPPHWVNRGYYDNENTTDDDVIVFEAGVALSETSSIGMVSSINISISIDDIEAWASSVSFVGVASNPDVSSEIHIKSNSSHGLSPSEHVTFILEIFIPEGRAETLNLTIVTKEIATERETPFFIENVGLSSIDKNLICIHFDKYFQNDSKKQLSAGDTANLNIKYMNGDNTSTLEIQFDVRLNHDRVQFDDSFVVVVYAQNKTTKASVDLNRPEILNDKNKTALSRIRQMLDGNDTTCSILPLKGERPPVLLMKMLTSWLNIERKAFDVMIKGIGISCDSHGKRSILVSFPTNVIGKRFQGFYKICSLINKVEGVEESETHCTYKCDCKGDIECDELIIFISNEEQSGKWSLCQLSAQNL